MMRRAAGVALTIALAWTSVPSAARQTAEYLGWTREQAQRIGQGMRANGRVGGLFDLRVVHTERSYNYKLRATWLTPDVIRATARLAQLTDGLSASETENLVKEAEAVRDTVVLVEIDPREGSGVVPLEWQAFLGLEGAQPGDPSIVKGKSVPALRDVRALSGVYRRDYNYERFWIVFPLRSGAGRDMFADSASGADLVVRIYDKEGRVSWPVPDSIGAGRVGAP